ncbi:protein split ends-like [Rhagoletis pomonella]|uniref:protein split ends-like n=1 Tax=Rhagoletis pomonella TaxID=28610 RepID=UPI0017870345|nr:protein split ends-like [Rhagoletis pomonella]
MKAAMHVDDETLTSQLGHPSMPGMGPPPHHQTLNLSDKQRAEMLDIPMKKAKGLDETSAYQLEYQRYQSLMYAHCAQQQRVGSMSAFRPWAPKSFLHPAATYNAVAAFSTLPYLSQEPPVLQNPERVVRSTDRERFERTYQPNVALVPRKCILTKDREKEQREYREREREREVERMREREQERKLERSREREQTREREQRELERDRRDREMQQHRQQHLLQQQNLHQQQQTLQEHAVLTNLCATEVQIKQERANTPNEMLQSPPLTNVSGGGDENPTDRRSNGPLDEDTILPMISPMLKMNQQQRKMPSNNNSSSNHSNSNSSSNHSDVEQQQQHQVQEQQQSQSRRHSLYTSNSSACSTSSTTSNTPPQQQLLPAHLPPSQQYQQQQQHQRHIQHLTLQPQATRLRQSPRTYPPSPTDTHSSEEFSGSNEITSSTSPAPCNENKCISRGHAPHHSLNQESSREQKGQPLIATVNQHAKLLPTPISATLTASNNNELPSRIRISKNLINRANIIRSPTPPPPLPLTSTLAQLHPQQEQHHHPQQQQPQLQALQHHQQQYEYFKQNQRLIDQQRQQHHHHHQQQPLSSIQQPNLIMRTHHSQQTQHSPTPAQSSTSTGLNLSTHSTKATMSSHTMDAQNHQPQPQQPPSHNGIPYIGSEFELSTDTDDDSVSGEADSSNILVPWDMAVEALRDTRPKERERVLNFLRKLLHENQQMRYSNLQLSEMIYKRDAMIRDLRDQLQTCRRHMQMLSLHQEMPGPTNGAHRNDSFQDEEIQKSLSSTEGRYLENHSQAKVGAEINGNDVHARNVGNATETDGKKSCKQSTNGQLTESDEEGDRKRSEDDNDKSSDAESEDDVADDRRSDVVMQDSVTSARGSGNHLNESDAISQPLAKRSRVESDSESSSSLNQEPKPASHAGQQTSHKVQHNNSFDSEDETPSTHTERNTEMDTGDDYSNAENKEYPELNENNDLSEDEEEATRFTVTKDSSSDTSDEDGDQNSEPLNQTRVGETDVQAPHSSALATPPTATTPLSPHSAATAGQLFDSSNSSDESSMKKAQMSASNALAKITEAADDTTEQVANQKEKVKFDEVEDSCDEEEVEDGDQGIGSVEVEPSENIGNKFIINKAEYCSRRGRHIIKANLHSGKSRETRKALDCEDNKLNVNVKANNTAGVEQLTRAPLATKASKKQTPTTNVELRIKEELI